jgi:hypothetical protein
VARSSAGKDAHPAPGVKNKQIIITAGDCFGPNRQRELQILIVLWVAAIGDLHRGLKPYGSVAQSFQDALTPYKRDCTRKLRAVQNSGNLSINRNRKSEHIDFFGMQQSPLRNTVRLERKD